MKRQTEIKLMGLIKEMVKKQLKESKRNTVELPHNEMRMYQSIFRKVDPNKYGSTYLPIRKKLDKFLGKHRDTLDFSSFDVKRISMISQLEEAEITLNDGSVIHLTFH